MRDYIVFIEEEMKILPIRDLNRIFFPFHEIDYIPISLFLIKFHLIGYLQLVTSQSIVFLDLGYLI